ncbi:MAG: hypothetical protein O9346_08955 [Leptospiraceae bacterium]|nr:hypothetical protein [Leptospiraceae bacterium]MCZ8346531.1 hypothetical protein [Leptospiraceae bacterium]
MSLNKIFLTCSLFFQLTYCNYVPLFQDPKPTQDIEPLLASIVLVNNAVSFLNFEFSSCTNAETIASAETKTGSLSGQKMKFYRLNGPGAGSQNINFSLRVQRSNPSNNLTPIACLVVGKQNRNIDTGYSFDQVDIPRSTDRFSFCPNDASIIPISASPSFRCIGIEAYEDITFTLRTTIN